MEQNCSHSRSAGRNKVKRVSPSLLERINPNAAGLDIGAEEIWVCVPEGRDETNVQMFPTFRHGSESWRVRFTLWEPAPAG